MSEERVKIVEFCCPKCRDKGEIEVELGRFRIEKFDFNCTCGFNFKYQYGNISCGNEMSRYKNPYTNEILDEIKRIED